MTTEKPTADTDEEPNVPSDLVHCFRLVFQVAPGGSRKAEFFIAGTIDEIKQAAMDDLGSGSGAYHALFYGETIVLQCWEGSTKVSSIDLHPFITYIVEGIAEPVTFEGEGSEPPLDMGELEELALQMAEDEVELSVTIDWARVKLPALGGRPLKEGEWAALDEPAYPRPYGFTAAWDMPLHDP